MALDIQAVTFALAARLETISGLRVTAYTPGQGSPPFAWVALPERVEYDHTFKRATDRAYMQLVVATSAADDRQWVTLATPYLSGVGTQSVKVAVEGDKTLGGTVQTCRVTEAKARLGQAGGTGYYFLIFVVEVIG